MLGQNPEKEKIKEIDEMGAVYKNMAVLDTGI